MGKIEVKTSGVMITIMILLIFRQTEGNALCKAKCVIKCTELAFPPPNCLKDCESHCADLSSNNPVFNCIDGCHLMKSIAINIGTYSLKIFTYSHNFIIFLYI